MSSLRFRLPALFLVGIVVAGSVTALIAATLFQRYARDETLFDLRRQAAALADLYAEQAMRTAGEGKQPPRFAAPRLEKATGTRLYYAGVNLVPGAKSGLRELPVDALPSPKASRSFQTFEFRPPGSDRTYLAASHPLKIGGETFGALVVAKPRADVRDAWTLLVQRLALAFLGGVAIAAALVVYLSRRLTKPLLALSRATDEVAAGRYDVELPTVKVTRDQGGGYYVHGRGHFIFFEERETAERKRRELELEIGFGGRFP